MTKVELRAMLNAINAEYSVAHAEFRKDWSVRLRSYADAKVDFERKWEFQLDRMDLIERALYLMEVDPQVTDPVQALLIIDRDSPQEGTDFDHSMLLDFDEDQLEFSFEE